MVNYKIINVVNIFLSPLTSPSFYPLRGYYVSDCIGRYINRDLHSRCIIPLTDCLLLIIQQN